MDRLNKALIWLAGLSLICGLFVAFTSQMSVSFQGPSLGGAGGFAPTFFRMLTTTWIFEAMRLSSVLTGGATMLGIVTAWAGRRRTWLVALLVVTILTWLWPTAVQAWQIATVAPQVAVDGPSPETMYFTNLSMFAVPLIPVVMALLLALTHRRLASATTPTSTDAELGIVRSSL